MHPMQFISIFLESIEKVAKTGEGLVMEAQNKDGTVVLITMKREKAADKPKKKAPAKKKIAKKKTKKVK